jgi:hypothetical protein
MPKKKDENESAFHALQEIIARDAERDGVLLNPEPQPQKVPTAVKAGRLGGLKGGKARAKRLSGKKRKAIAKKAAKTRWKDNRKQA